MRKLILTWYKWQTGSETYDGYRMVVVNHLPNETEEDLTRKAQHQLLQWFPSEYPQSQWLSVKALPTIGELPVTDERNDSGLHFTNFHSMDEHPEVGDGGYSYDVLIDLDGWRKDFRIGYYDKDNGWEVYQHYLDGESTKLDLNQGRWTYLPINKGKKAEEPEPSSGDITHAVNSIMDHFKKKEFSVNISLPCRVLGRFF